MSDLNSCCVENLAKIQTGIGAILDEHKDQISNFEFTYSCPSCYRIHTYQMMGNLDGWTTSKSWGEV